MNYVYHIVHVCKKNLNKTLIKTLHIAHLLVFFQINYTISHLCIAQQ